jgi:hypothetical protein
MTPDEIAREIQLNAGTQFDARVADAALALLLDRRYESVDFFSGMGSYATISLTVGGRSGNTVQRFGQIRRIQALHVFYPLEKMPSVESAAISDCALYVEVNERIFEFGADIRQFLPDRILINCVTPQQTEDMFSVLWHTRGTLITSEKAVHNIYISILGGDYMDFPSLATKAPPRFPVASSGWP